MRSCFLGIGSIVVLTLTPLASRAQGVPAEYRQAIANGLDWLVKQQNKDGSWPSVERQGDVTCTAAAGLALLMEGSTAAKGKYSANIKQAVEWLMKECQQDGLIGLNVREDRLGYMTAQGWAVLFLGSVLAREERSDGKGLEGRLAKVRQQEMATVLKRAVDFIVKAQAKNGGWGVTSLSLDDAESTLAQILALRAAQHASIDVSRESMQKAYAYLETMTTPRGGMPFSSLNAGKSGSERPGLTIAAFACTYGSKEVSADLLKKWLGYCQFTLTTQTSQSKELFHLAIAVHGLGDDGHAKLLGKEPPVRTWSKYRDVLLSRFRTPPGTAHRGWNASPTFGTAISLIVLQLDNDYLPVFQMKRKW